MIKGKSNGSSFAQMGGDNPNGVQSYYLSANLKCYHLCWKMDKRLEPCWWSDSMKNYKELHRVAVTGQFAHKRIFVIFYWPIIALLRGTITDKMFDKLPEFYCSQKILSSYIIISNWRLETVHFKIQTWVGPIVFKSMTHDFLLKNFNKWSRIFLCYYWLTTWQGAGDFIAVLW